MDCLRATSASTQVDTPQPKASAASVRGIRVTKTTA
jgi:hypothetical protein